MKYGFGVDLGGTTVKIAYFDQEGTMLHKWEIPTVTANKGNQILPDIAAAIRGYLAENQIPDSDIIGVGIGVPGPVNRHGIVGCCENLGWGVVNVSEELTKLTGLPSKAGNDATVAALGECWKGEVAYDNIIFITLGTGVGGGIIVDGKPVYGRVGGGGEIGHLVLNSQESIPCNCGKYGCAEQYCSATGIVRTAKRFMNRDNRPSSLRHIENLTCKDIFDASAAGDAVAADILEQVYDQMAEFIADLCCVLDPDAVIIGGGVSKAGQVLLDGIQRHYHKYIFHPLNGVAFALAALGNDAGAYGAFKLVLDASK